MLLPSSRRLTRRPEPGTPPSFQLETWHPGDRNQVTRITRTPGSTGYRVIRQLICDASPTGDVRRV